MLAQLPEVEKQSLATAQPASAIIERAAGFDLLILGATAQPLASPVSLGQVADEVTRSTSVPVLAVKSRRPMPQHIPDETSGAQAISILVDKWFAAPPPSNPAAPPPSSPTCPPATTTA